MSEKVRQWVEEFAEWRQALEFEVLDPHTLKIDPFPMEEAG